MNLVIVTTLAFAVAVEARISAPHALFGAEQLSFMESEHHCEGCQPDYCYPKDVSPDYDCYKYGYPKCCTKNKGNCPNDVANKPGCECAGVCDNSAGFTDESCSIGDGHCKGLTYCNAEDGVCDAAPGRCVRMATQCGREMLPVCGCNCVTYSNRCEASAVGVSVASSYACGEAATCTLGGNECGNGDFCSVDDGQCLLKAAGISGDYSGTCRPRREVCSKSESPVCGCDGNTYENASCAKAEGVNVAANIPCL